MAVLSHPLPAGTRVRNYGEQWPDALLHGTAAILATKPSGSDGFEYQVQRDEALIPGYPNTPTWWASHMTYVTREGEQELSL